MANRRIGEAVQGAEMRVEWLGRMEYRAAWEVQRKRAAQRLAGEIPDTLLLLEHPPTLTLGRAADRSHIVATVERLEREGVAVVESDRGGMSPTMGRANSSAIPSSTCGTLPTSPTCTATYGTSKRR